MASRGLTRGADRTGLLRARVRRQRLRSPRCTGGGVMGVVDKPDIPGLVPDVETVSAAVSKQDLSLENGSAARSAVEPLLPG